MAGGVTLGTSPCKKVTTAHPAQPSEGRSGNAAFEGYSKKLVVPTHDPSPQLLETHRGKAWVEHGAVKPHSANLAARFPSKRCRRGR